MRPLHTGTFAATAMACVLWLSAVHGFDTGGDRTSLGGSLRGTSALSRNYEQPLLWGPENRTDGQHDLGLRLVADGVAGDRVDWELHAVQALTLSRPASANTGSGALMGGGARSSYRAVDTRWQWSSEQDVQAWLYLDRANFRVTFDRADITIGRQAITLGKAYFWNPLDVFLPFGATQFDRDYKAGVDAVRLDTALDALSGVTLIGVPGREESAGGDTDLWYRSALLGRAYGNIGEWDAAVQGGKILGGYQLGGAVAGEVGSIEVRAESALLLSQDEPGSAAPVLEDHLSAVLGLGRSFVEGDLQAQVEYFFNGGAEGRRTRRFDLIGQGRLQQVNRHLLGGVATYQLHPLLVGSMALVWGVEDGSRLLQPGLTYSAADEVEVLAGAVVARGARPQVGADGLRLRSEFGTYPSYYYLESKIYF